MYTEILRIIEGGLAKDTKKSIAIPSYLPKNGQGWR